MPPATPPSPARRPGYGERRGELVQAAIRVVAAQGIAGLSHRSVAREAGVTHGLVRHHFGTMTSLIAEALDTILPQSLRRNPVSLLLADPGYPEEDLVSWIDEQTDLQVFEYEVLLATRHTPELRPLAEHLYRGYEDSVRSAFAEHDLPSPADAHVTLILAAIEGLVLHRVTFRRDDGPTITAAFVALRAAIRLAVAADGAPST